MKKVISYFSLFLFIIFISLSCQENQNLLNSEQELTLKQQLGKKMFFDKNLSNPTGQSCSSCHDPEFGFGNPNTSLPVSQGANLDRFGNRNDLPAAYAGFSPEFHYDEEEGLYVGGQFWDGRSSTLEEQAKGPFLNPLEMANPDEQAVIDKIKNTEYVDLFRKVFGDDALQNTEKAYDFIAEALADYERSYELNKFNSKYDYYLKGKADLTPQEARGFAIFVNEEKGNCAACHPHQVGENGSPPLFTDYTYDNLGVPKNAEIPFYYLPEELNPDGVDFVDQGLGAIVNKPEEMGKFKVPTLRNIEKTAPYMHNGIFKTLRQVVIFYNTRSVGPWPEPEVSENVNEEELGNLGLTDQEIDDLVAFMETLTDDYQVEK